MTGPSAADSAGRLALAEGRLRDLVELSSDWLWEQDAEYRFVALLPGAGGATGPLRNTPIGLRRWELPLSGVTDEQWRSHRAQLERREPFRGFTYAIAGEDGTERWFEVSGKPFFAAGGAFAGYRGFTREVTGRRRADMALRDAEQRLRALLDFSADWYWRQDEQHRLTVREGAVLAKNLLPPAEDLGKAPWEIGYLNMTEADWAAHRALLERREPFRDLLLARRNAAGEMRWARLSGTPLFDAAGRFVGYHGIGHGVTAQIEAEQALQKREAQLRLLTDSVPAAIGYVDRHWVLRFANRGFRELFAHLPVAAVGLHVSAIMGEARFAQVRPHFARVFAGAPVAYQRNDIGTDGKPRVFSVRLVPHLDEAGQVQGCYSLTLDVTASQEAEAKIRGLERMFAAALENTTDLTAIYRVDGERLIIERFNPAVRAVSSRLYPGDRLDDWIGRSLEDFMRDVTRLAPADIERRMGYFRQAVATAKVVQYRSVLSSASDTQHIDVLLVPVANAEGRVTHVTYRGADITELLRKEEELRRLNAGLEQVVTERTSALTAAMRELESFAYAVSHDLRTPLRGIEGYSRLLMEAHAEALGEEGLSHLARVRRATLRMDVLIDDLLRLSQVTRAALVRESVDLSALAAEVAADLQQQAVDRRVDWRLQGDVRVAADPGLMRVLVENLLGNAWKYSRDRAPAVIEFGAARVPGGVEVRVRDNGAGFDMAHAGKLFKAFQRLHRHAEFEGSGIGLATVARIAERHGGRVRAQGETGRGAEFVVYLPD